MKKLYLIGDSIRMCYASFIEEALKGKAEVYWPNENSRFSAYTYYALGDWEEELRVGKDCDVIHWNVGLHDIIRFTGDEPVSSPEIYELYLEKIIHRLKFLYPDATQVFANTTPVLEERHSFWLDRKNEDVDKINKVAEKVMKKNNILINDLHSIVTPECIIDHCHISTPLGRELAVKQILKTVCPLLDIDYDSLTMPDFHDEQLAARGDADFMA